MDISYPLVPLEKILNSFVESKVEPSEVENNSLRWDIQLVTKEAPEIGPYEIYEYKEAVFQDKTKSFLIDNKEAIIANPLSFDPKMLNGYYLY